MAHLLLGSHWCSTVHSWKRRYGFFTWAGLPMSAVQARITSSVRVWSCDTVTCCTTIMKLARSSTTYSGIIWKAPGTSCGRGKDTCKHHTFVCCAYARAWVLPGSWGRTTHSKENSKLTRGVKGCL